MWGRCAAEWGGRAVGAQQNKIKCKHERHSLARKRRGGIWCEIEWHEDGALEFEIKTCMHVRSIAGKRAVK